VFDPNAASPPTSTFLQNDVVPSSQQPEELNNSNNNNNNGGGGGGGGNTSLVSPAPETSPSTGNDAGTSNEQNNADLSSVVVTPGDAMLLNSDTSLGGPRSLTPNTNAGGNSGNNVSQNGNLAPPQSQPPSTFSVTPPNSNLSFGGTTSSSQPDAPSLNGFSPLEPRPNVSAPPNLGAEILSAPMTAGIDQAPETESLTSLPEVQGGMNERN